MPRKSTAATCKPPTKTKTYSGKTYKRSARPYPTKAKAEAAKNRKKKSGGSARLIKNPCGSGYYVYARGGTSRKKTTSKSRKK